MEGHMTKRSRRIYSLEPNKILGPTFAQKYVHHLVPALKEINKKKSSGHKDDYALMKTLRYEVDMALVLSTEEGFAWSRALKNNLRRDDITTVGRFYSSSIHNRTTSFELPTCNKKDTRLFDNKFDDRLMAVTSRIDQNVSVYPKCTLKNTVEFKCSKRSKMKEPVNQNQEAENERISHQLISLRKLLPGGNQLDDVEELLVEMGSYLVCLQQQVHILHCLVETHD